jgi:hypothetical protein
LTLFYGTIQYTNETKKKISNSVKKLWENEEYRNNQIERLKNIKRKPCSDETKKKISESTMGKNKGNIPWNKGKNGIFSEEILRKKSMSMKGKFDGKNNPSYGKKWLNKNGKNLYVKKEDIDIYLNKGYKLGMIKRYNKK